MAPIFPVRSAGPAASSTGHNQLLQGRAVVLATVLAAHRRRGRLLQLIGICQLMVVMTLAGCNRRASPVIAFA